jgi:hypothetical protein
VRIERLHATQYGFRGGAVELLMRDRPDERLEGSQHRARHQAAWPHLADEPAQDLVRLREMFDGFFVHAVFLLNKLAKIRNGL